MNNLLPRLKALPAPIRIGVVGIGSVGKGLVYQAGITPGMQCVGMADVEIERAVACADAFGLGYRVVDSLAEMHAAIETGQIAICADAALLARCELMDVFIDGSNAIAAAGRFDVAALEHGKHLVMMNAEADLLFGPYFLQQAQKNGLVYTSCDGDQPVVIRRLIDELQLWGFELVMAGNIKGFLDRYSDPTKIIPEADKRNLDYKMCTSYTDGTKLCVEMALVANAYGLRTDVPGMHGPRMASVYDMFEHFDFEALWQSREAVVDYVLGAKPNGGVFAIGYADHPFQQYTLDWFPPRMGPGPFYLFYKPYHLGHIMAMTSVAEAFLDQRGALQPDYGLRTNVYAYAKRNLRAGEELDGLGGYCCYGLIENCADNEDNPGLPALLADRVRLKRDIPADEKIALADVDYDSARADFALHARAAAITTIP